MAVDTYLVSYWDLDEGLGLRYDSASTNHLTDNGTCPPVADSVFGYVAGFDYGNVEFLSHVDNAELSVGDIDFVVAGWFYLKDKNTAQTVIGHYATASPQRAWQIYYTQANDQFEAIFSYDGTSTVGHYIILEDTVLGSPTAATWYFIVLWHDATANTVNMQINNGGISSEAWSDGVHDSTAPLTIGGIMGTSSDSKICRVGLWKNGLLSSGEKTWLYNSGAGRTYEEIDPPGANDFTTNLISHWRLDGVEDDAHTNGYDLTNNSAVGFVDAGILRNTGTFLQAATFVNVTGDYFSRADNADLSTGDNDFVIAAWVRINNLSDDFIIACKDDGSTSREYFLSYSNSDSTFLFTVYNAVPTGAGVTAQSEGAPRLGAWYLVIGWYDSTANTINIQIGDEETTGLLPLNAKADGGITPTDTSAAFGIGGPIAYGSAEVQGVSFWKGGLFNKTEKLAYYNKGFGLDYPFTVSPFYSDALVSESGVYSYGKGSAVDENQIGSHTALASLDISGTRYQVAGYWNENSYLTIGWREMGGTWTNYTFSAISVPGDDRHDAVSIGLDPDGYVHVWYAHHNNALNYAKSNAALPSWTGTLTTGLAMTGSNETSITYPFIFNDPTGKLYCRVRNGPAAANGNWYLKSYNEGTTTWSGVTGAGTDGLIVNGIVSTDGMYGPEPKFTDDFDGAGTGEMFLIWQWRKGGTYDEDFCFARWDGTNWTQADGSSQTMPITISNCETFITISSSVEQFWGGITYDSQDRPHMIYYEADGSADLQMKHAVYDAGWEFNTITATAGSSFQVGETFAVGDRVYTFYKDFLQNNYIRLMYSGVDDYATWNSTVLYPISLHDPASTDGVVSFHYDRDYYRESGIIHLLLQPWWASLGQKPISLIQVPTGEVVISLIPVFKPLNEEQARMIAALQL